MSTNQHLSWPLQAAFLAIAAAAGLRAQANQAPMTINKVTPNLYEVDGKGGNVVVYVTGEGVILVDDKNPGEAISNELQALIRTVTNQPIKYVFITHYHQDHIGGSAQMMKLGAQVISTVNTREYILGPVFKATQVYDLNGKFVREQPYNAAYANGEWAPVGPQLVFTQEMDVFLGGKEVRARYFGPAHTGGDAFIFFPSEKVIAVGDNMRPFCSICVDYHAGGSIVEYIKTLDGLLNIEGGRKIANLDDFDIVIPGHGEVSNRAGLREHRDKLVKLRDRVVSLKHEGKSYSEIAKVMMDEYGWKAEDRDLGQWTFPGMMKELR
jgi:glyoxylase-like metal-dependent hydrolase (beta-lactamase superfamily II)